MDWPWRRTNADEDLSRRVDRTARLDDGLMVVGAVRLCVALTQR